MTLIEKAKDQNRVSEAVSMYQTALALPEMPPVGRKGLRRKPSQRANKLDGATWTKYSISVWSDIKKTKEEVALKHPAIFPLNLAIRLIECFTNEEDKVILDPFVGIGTTAIAAEMKGKIGVGIEISEEFSLKARMRPLNLELRPALLNDIKGERIIYTEDSRNLRSIIKPSYVDLVITSPPYWDILLQERTADYKEIRHYGKAQGDLGKIKDYSSFLKTLREIFVLVYEALKPSKYCCVIVMDLRKKDRFYPLHSDVATFMQEIGFIYDDIIIWDRRHEYNNMRPLGYPFKFRINKAHEYILVFKKPSAGSV